MNVPNITPVSTPTNVQAYTEFRGVDFSTDATQVDPSRSPGAKNMISDMRGYPEKRPGWRILHRDVGNVNGLFNAVFSDDTAGRYAHIGTDLYSWDDTDAAPVLLIAGCLANARSFAFNEGGKVYILDGTRYRVLSHKDGAYEMENVDETEVYVPTIQIAITGETITTLADKSTIGGHTFEPYEEANILTPKRKCLMVGDGTSKEFFLPDKDVTSVDNIVTNHVQVDPSGYTVDLIKGRIKFTTAPAIGEDGAGTSNIEVEYTCTTHIRDYEYHTGDGTQTVFTYPEEGEDVSEVDISGTEKKRDTDYTVDTAAHTVTFNTAPANGKKITITWNRIDDHLLPARINACTFADTFGFYNDNRWFLSGDPTRKYWHIDYMSGSGDPTYFPVDGWTGVGAETSPIMGYMKQYDGQLIIKADNEQDAQIFIRNAEQNSSSEIDATTGWDVVYPVKQGIRGVGAVAKNAFGVLRDSPLFFAKEGVYGVVSGQVRNQQSVQDKSFFVNAKLTKEEHPENAQAVVWNGYYILSLNGRAYVADSRQQTGMSSTEYAGYEWYYWENIPVKFWYSYENELYFADNSGNICRFNSDDERMTRYADGGYPGIRYNELTAEEQTEYDRILSEENLAAAEHYRKTLYPGEAIDAVWTTKADTFGTITNVKNIMKRGCAVMIRPNTRSSVDIGYLSNRDGTQSIKKVLADIFDFSDIDFERITFNTFDLPMVIPINRKIKKFNILQIVLRNRELNEGFGVYGMQLTYTVGGFVKN